jgi:hypothetical protein
MRNDKTDAACLRDAAWVLRTRAMRRTFMLRVIIRVLERTADRIEHSGRHPEDAETPRRQT